MKTAQVTIANGANQTEKNNQRVQLSYPAWDWAEIAKYSLAPAWEFEPIFNCDAGYMWITFEYKIKRSPYEVVRCSERTRHTDFPENYSLN